MLRLRRSLRAVFRVPRHVHALLLPAAHAVLAPARHRLALSALRDPAPDARARAVPPPQDDRRPAAATGVQVAGARVLRLPGQRAGPAAVGPHPRLRLGRAAVRAGGRHIRLPQDEPTGGADVQRGRGGTRRPADPGSHPAHPAVPLRTVADDSVLRRCWLGDRKGIRPVKKLDVCWW